MNNFEIKIIKIQKPDDMNFILGQTHFIYFRSDSFY
jgi:adenosine/AMP kinase